MFKKMKHKSNGILDDILPTLIFLMVMAVMLFAFINYNKAVNQKTAINNVAREYLLKMETTGYMTGEIEEALINRLTAMGYRGDAEGGVITTTNLMGTTLVDVGYGNEITLSFVVYTTNTIIAGTVTKNGIPDISIDPSHQEFDIWRPKIVTSKYVPISITYKSTSKE